MDHRPFEWKTPTPPECSEDFSLLVVFLLVTFSWLFRGFSVALFCLEKQCLGLFRGFFVVFSWLFRGFFVAPVLGKIYAYSRWNSLLRCLRLGRPAVILKVHIAWYL